MLLFSIFGATALVCSVQGTSVPRSIGFANSARTNRSGNDQLEWEPPAGTIERPIPIARDIDSGQLPPHHRSVKLKKRASANACSSSSSLPASTSTTGPSSTASSSPPPNFAIYLSNNTVHTGFRDQTATTDFASNVHAGLAAFCPDPVDGNDGQCDTTQAFNVTDLLTVVGTSYEHFTLAFQFEDSQYQNTTARDWMLAAAVAGFQQAAVNASDTTCQPTPYSYVQTEKGPCNKPPTQDPGSRKRDPGPVALPIGPNAGLEGTDGKSGGTTCYEKMNICNGPNHITSILAGATNPYANHMNLGITFHLEEKTPAFTKWECELVIGTLAALTTYVAPEFVGAEWGTAEDLEAVCGPLTDDGDGEEGEGEGGLGEIVSGVLGG
ncbi:hypothetical protein K402DRAFT_419178 [Aulographum hederae CBS 113979]|uniref:Uncharacterized protein n=1 Tax=Aulographum hederae CBS 113979 TaxID=1176131 RepID=A0A6G1H729_9PEZI|nr:hypothetical protein K402DRAFT_419178 [Aulographum hederae CBS 113979]